MHWSLFATLTPSEDSPAAPTISLSADPSSVLPEGLSTLTWSTTNATTCTASNVGAEGSTWWGAKPTSGSDVRGPLTATATYSLSCTGPGGTASQSVTVVVTGSPPPAPTVTLTATPSSVSPGGLSTLTWSTTNATTCTASNVGAEGSTWRGAKPTSGSDVRGPLAATATYSLSCAGPGGTASQSVTVVVTGSPPAAPTVALTAIPSSISAGNSTTLAWVSANATGCIASGAWSGSRAISGESAVSPTSTSTYILTCTGMGGSASDSVTVTVSVPAPTVNLTATPTTINAGQSTTLTWSSTNATGCTATGGWSGAQLLSGELVVATTSTATYVLTCIGVGGSTAKSVTVTVIGGPAQLSLTWVDNADGTARVKVERKTGTSGTYGQIAMTSVGATEYVDTTPVTGTTYCYRVRASNVNGDSDYSNEACKVP